MDFNGEDYRVSIHHVQGEVRTCGSGASIVIVPTHAKILQPTSAGFYVTRALQELPFLEYSREFK